MKPNRLRNTILLAFAGSAASIAAAYDDGHGKSWRQLTETEVLTWQQVAAVCPTDGRTPCNGAVAGVSLSSWTWATQRQVMDLFNRVLPDDPKHPNRGKLSIDHPGIAANIAYFGLADHYLSNVFAPTSRACSNYFCDVAVIGWTASKSAKGKPVVGAVIRRTTSVTLEGSFSVSDLVTTELSQTDYGVWMWRPIAGIPEPSTAWLLAGGMALLARRLQRAV